MFVWILFEGKLIEVFENSILSYLSNIEFTKQINTLSFVIILFPIYVIYLCPINNYYILFLSFLSLSFLVFIYVKYRLLGTYISTPTIGSNLGYTDILIILLGIFLISCLSLFVYCEQKKQNCNCVFIPEVQVYEPQFGILDYYESAKQLAKDLNRIQVENSYSIGIITPFGTIRTPYLNLLKYHLNDDNFLQLEMITINQDLNSVACEPFWNQLFGNADVPKLFIHGLDKAFVPRLKLVKNFCMLYENNINKPIGFKNQGNILEKFDENLLMKNDKFT